MRTFDHFASWGKNKHGASQKTQGCVTSRRRGWPQGYVTGSLPRGGGAVGEVPVPEQMWVLLLVTHLFITNPSPAPTVSQSVQTRKRGDGLGWKGEPAGPFHCSILMRPQVTAQQKDAVVFLGDKVSFSQQIM